MKFRTSPASTFMCTKDAICWVACHLHSYLARSHFIRRLIPFTPCSVLSLSPLEKSFHNCRQRGDIVINHVVWFYTYVEPIVRVLQLALSLVRGLSVVVPFLCMYAISMPPRCEFRIAADPDSARGYNWFALLVFPVFGSVRFHIAFLFRVSPSIFYLQWLCISFLPWSFNSPKLATLLPQFLRVVFPSVGRVGFFNHMMIQVSYRPLKSFVFIITHWYGHNGYE